MLVISRGPMGPTSLAGKPGNYVVVELKVPGEYLDHGSLPLAFVPRTNLLEIHNQHKATRHHATPTIPLASHDTMAPAATDHPEKQDTDVPVPKPLPKGVVLGPDGKPCRTCTDIKSWLALTGTKPAPKPPTSTNSTNDISSTNDCPPDVAALGRSSWTLLHSIAATYPETPTASLQSETRSFLSAFGKLYPCWVCAEDFQAWMATNTPRVSSRSELGMWMCEAHNAVNEKLGKRAFDCTRWEERWRTGWRDGRCG